MRVRWRHGHPWRTVAIVSQRQSRYATNGDTVRELRDRAGYSLREFARLVGTDPTHLSRIENAKGQPSNKLRNAIAKALGVDIDRIAPRENGAV